MRQYTSANITCHITPAAILSGATDVVLMIRQDSTGIVQAYGPGAGLVIDSEEGTASITLTRNQSNAFEVGPALVQVRGKTGTQYWATSIARIMVERILETGYVEFYSGEGSASVNG